MMWVDGLCFEASRSLHEELIYCKWLVLGKSESCSHRAGKLWLGCPCSTLALGTTVRVALECVESFLLPFLLARRVA